MASTVLISSPLHSSTNINLPKSTTILSPSFHSFRKSSCLSSKLTLSSTPMLQKNTLIAAVSTKEVPKAQSQGGFGNFVDEMRSAAMKLHSKNQAKEGQQEPDMPPVNEWEISINGYIRYVVNTKIIYDMLEAAIQKATHPSYAKFRNTGLERSDALQKDLEWFKEQGHAIPEPSSSIVSYAHYLEELAEKDRHAFVCHFYNFYFANITGGQIIGKKVSEIIPGKKELEFYKFEGNLKQLGQQLKEKINEVAANWPSEEKEHCLEETQISFKYKKEIHRFLLS